jgi:hypothetical protein
MCSIIYKCKDLAMTDNNQQRKKWCKDCDTIKCIETGFYKGGSGSYQSRCKECHNKHRQVCRLNAPKPPPKERKPCKPRINSFQKMSSAEQDELLKYHKTMTLTKLALKCQIKLSTLKSLHRRGLIKKDNP